MQIKHIKSAVQDYFNKTKIQDQSNNHGAYLIKNYHFRKIQDVTY